MQQVPDPYRALGVPRGASDAEIKAAHRKLAKRFHPDAAGGETHRFLSVQEAYRVLSDPLLRREWDARHAPGPVRAGQPTGSRPRPARQPRGGVDQGAPPRPRSSRAPRPGREERDESGAAASGEAPPPGPGRPRSSRAYTWSASEVPWWEEGARRESRRRTARNEWSETADGEGRKAAGGEPPETANGERPDMDVYNRSSGAAWSMAARAYFRRGDQELPRRGSFHHRGTQPLTAARARAAAEAEARRRPATQPPDAAPRPRETRMPRHEKRAGGPGRVAPAYAYAQEGVARDAFEVARARESFVRRLRGQSWPSLSHRLLLALLAWLPVAGLLTYGASAAERYDESVMALAMALSLVALVALPRLAYFAALGTIGAALGAAAGVAVLAVLGARMPPTSQSITTVAVVVVAAYFATIGAVLLLGQRARPWTR